MWGWHSHISSVYRVKITYSSEIYGAKLKLAESSRLVPQQPAGLPKEEILNIPAWVIYVWVACDP